MELNINIPLHFKLTGTVKLYGSGANDRQFKVTNVSIIDIMCLIEGLYHPEETKFIEWVVVKGNVIEVYIGS